MLDLKKTEKTQMNHLKILTLGAALFITAAVETQAVSCLLCPNANLITVHFTCYTKPGQQPVCTAPSITFENRIWSPTVPPTLNGSTSINLQNYPKLTADTASLYCKYPTNIPGVSITLTTPKLNCNYTVSSACGKQNQFSCQ